jgi:osmotically-inducible protein OsmY
MTIEDTRLRRRLQKELARRSIDSTKIMVEVTHGICELSGEIRPLRGMRISLEDELEIIEVTLRRIHGVRDIKMNVKIPVALRKY